MMTLNALRAGATVLIAGACLVGCAKEPQAVNEEAVVKEAAELFTPPAVQPPAIVAPETVLVVVNGKEFTQKNVNDELAKMVPNASEIPPAQLAQMQAQMNDRILETLIIKELLTKEAAAENIQVTDEDLDKTIEEMKKTLPEGSTLDDQLARIGLTMDEFRAMLREDLRINNLMKQKLGLDKKPTEEQIKAFYEANQPMFQRPDMVKASHILVRVESEEDDAAAKAKMDEIVKKLADGADFAEVAKTESACPSAAKGGDLGSFGRGQMVPEFEDAAFAQEVGVVGDVVKTQFGYHVIKVTERTPAGLVSLEEAHDMIERRLQGEEGREAVAAYIDGLKAKAKIEYPSAK